MLLVRHYIDAPAGAIAFPPKRTTAMVLGQQGAKAYATLLALTAAGIYALLGFYVRPAFAFGAILTSPAIWAHASMRPWNLVSVTRNELRVVQLGVAAGLSVAVFLAPILWPLIPVAVVGYLGLLVVAAPPPELARAWIRGPRRTAEDANSVGSLSGP